MVGKDDFDALFDWCDVGQWQVHVDVLLTHVMHITFVFARMVKEVACRAGVGDDRGDGRWFCVTLLQVCCCGSGVSLLSFI